MTTAKGFLTHGIPRIEYRYVDFPERWLLASKTWWVEDTVRSTNPSTPSSSDLDIGHEIDSCTQFETVKSFSAFIIVTNIILLVHSFHSPSDQKPGYLWYQVQYFGAVCRIHGIGQFLFPTMMSFNKVWFVHSKKAAVSRRIRFLLSERMIHTNASQCDSR